MSKGLLFSPPVNTLTSALCLTIASVKGRNKRGRRERLRGIIHPAESAMSVIHGPIGTSAGRLRRHTCWHAPGDGCATWIRFTGHAPADTNASPELMIAADRQIETGHLGSRMRHFLLTAVAVVTTLSPASALAQSCVATAYPRVHLPPCQPGDRCAEGTDAQGGYVPNKADAEISTLPTPGSIVMRVGERSGETPGTSPRGADIISEGMVWGVNPNGGGYGVEIIPPGYEDSVARYGFGDGFQTSIRTELHAGLYNPTQAGAGWALGTPTTVTRVEADKANGYGTRLKISRYNVALFGGEPGDDPYDWWAHDSIRLGAGRDWRARRRSVNGTDSDTCRHDPQAGVERTLEDEVRSEFDFLGEVEQIDDFIEVAEDPGDTFGRLDIPAFRVLNWWEFAREPKSILQFLPRVVETERTYLSLYRKPPAAGTENPKA